jgi:two-component system cell cycle response regulator DivK
MGLSLSEAYIFVVEDDPNANLVTLDLLRMAGADHCFSRRSARTALTFAEKLPRVDLFLLDVNMPGKSGYDLLEEIRGHDRLGEAKVVAVTAGTLAEDVAKAHELGFDGFIGKPLQAPIFAEQVQRILDGEFVWEWR